MLARPSVNTGYPCLLKDAAWCGGRVKALEFDLGLDGSSTWTFWALGSAFVVRIKDTVSCTGPGSKWLLFFPDNLF